MKKITVTVSGISPFVMEVDYRPEKSELGNILRALSCATEIVSREAVKIGDVDSIACMPSYEDEVKADSDTLENIKNSLSKNTHLLKSEFFTIESTLPTPEELDNIFAQLCEEFARTPLSCFTFSAFFNEFVERTKGLIVMKMNVKPECMFSQNALRGKSIRPKH